MAYDASTTTSAESFDPADEADWIFAAEKALRGKPLASLDTTTADGVTRRPLYTPLHHGTAEDESGLPGAGPRTRGGHSAGTVQGWDIRQAHVVADAAKANEAILTDLERGVTSITLHASAATAQELDETLADVYLDLAGIHLAPGASQDQVTALTQLIESREFIASSALGSFGIDPIGRFARTGSTDGDINDVVAETGRSATSLRATHHNMTAIAIDGSVVADAGASDGQEIGAILSIGVAYLRALEVAGASIDEAAGALDITISIDADQFANIAKLRALRTCWARVVEACGGAESSRSIDVHAVTAASIMTRHDPWVNMLRTTTACFAAAVGGADAITVRPFDSAIGQSDDFALRIARNTQSILSEESQLSRVIDPAGGSWYVEDLTKQLAAAGWSEFQTLEAEGGIVASLLAGSLQSRVGTTKDQRIVDLASRAEPLTGVSEFPDIHETPVSRKPLPAQRSSGSSGSSCIPLVPFRRSEVFETYRDAADTHRDRPTVFLANLGPIATHTARSSFAKNLFEVGGLEALGNDGFATPAEAAAAFAASTAKIACICSSDSVYADLAGDTAEALKASGASLVFLAGTPGDDEVSWRAAGLDGFVTLGCDVLTVLATCHAAISQ
jgi:methylmalonyl-CoA mutase